MVPARISGVGLVAAQWLASNAGTAQGKINWRNDFETAANHTPPCLSLHTESTHTHTDTDTHTLWLSYCRIAWEPHYIDRWDRHMYLGGRSK